MKYIIWLTFLVDAIFAGMLIEEETKNIFPLLIGGSLSVLYVFLEDWRD